MQLLENPTSAPPPARATPPSSVDDRRHRRSTSRRGHVGDAGRRRRPASTCPSCAPPTRCEPFGSCRLCLVEIDGAKGTPASCTTPVSDGMVVRTQTDKVAKLRRGVMELYISDHPLDCLTCSANGDCELQDMAGVVGLREVRYGSGSTRANHLDAPSDTSNPYFNFDPSKCIVCSRCVRACDEVQGTFALTIDGRGFDSKIAAGGRRRSWTPSASRAGPACRPARRRRCRRSTVIELGVPTRTRADHLRLLRRGLLVQGRAARRRGGAHGPLQGRRRQRGPLAA